MHSKHAAILLFLAVNMISSAQSKRVEYPSEDEFDKRLSKNIEENAKRDGNVHGHIVAVNDAYFATRSVKDIPLTEDIEDANEGAGVNLFEGDIIPEDSSQSETSKRNIISNKDKMWPTKVVPYYVSPDLGKMKTKINLAINELEKHTCVRFKQVSGSYSGDHIRLIKGPGCQSSVGRRGGGQKLHLGKGCEYVGVIMHEMMHALGIWHEQSRIDRDSYVEVLWNNIKREKLNNFKKYSHGKLDDLKLPYDTLSIMHYDRYLFSVSPGHKATLVVRGRPWERLGGQLRATLTSNDAKEINALFSC